MIEGDYEGGGRAGAVGGRGEMERCVAAVTRESLFYPPLVTRTELPCAVRGSLMTHVWTALMVLARP